MVSRLSTVPNTGYRIFHVSFRFSFYFGDIHILVIMSRNVLFILTDSLFLWALMGTLWTDDVFRELVSENKTREKRPPFSRDAVARADGRGRSAARRKPWPRPRTAWRGSRCGWPRARVLYRCAAAGRGLDTVPGRRWKITWVFPSAAGSFREKSPRQSKVPG